MPHLRIRGLSSQQVQSLTSNLAEELAQSLGTQADHLTFEHVPSQFFFEGGPVSGWPFIDILMFERNLEQKKACAKILTQRVRALVGGGDVTVVFHILEKKNYFENSEHF